MSGLEVEDGSVELGDGMEGQYDTLGTKWGGLVVRGFCVKCAFGGSEEDEIQCCCWVCRGR